MACHEGVGFFTNDEDLADSFVDGELESHLTSNENFKSNYNSHLFFNLNYNNYPKSIKSNFDDMLDNGPRGDKKIFKMLDEMFASVENLVR